MANKPLPENPSAAATAQSLITNLQSLEFAPYWLSAIIESADDAIISKTLDGIITSWNKGAERIFGYTAEEVIGKSVTILIPPGHGDEEPTILSRLRAGERVEHYETIRRRKDGELIDISLTVSPIMSAHGRVIGASKIARDVTDRRRAQEALHRSTTRLNLALAASNLGDWSWDAKTDLVNLSETASRIFDIPVGQHLTWTQMQGLLHEEDREAAKAAVEQAINNHCDYDIEFRVKHADNSVVWVLAKGRGLYADDGTVVGMLGFVQDITRPKTTEEATKRAKAEAEHSAAENERLFRQAEESSRLKEEFLATVSHELRTPLNAILGWARMLRSGQLDNANAAKAIETIERNARAQAQLIDDLLDVSRIITGKLRLEIRAADPNSFIDAAVEALRPAADAKGVRVQKIIDTGAVSVPGDPVRLQQVVWNLLSNAVKFTSPGGRVQVQLERMDSHIEIIVSDTGQGIAPEFLPHVFDRFRQADQKTSRQHGGMGLGLAIVRHLVELHGGDVQAASEGEGKGSTFTVTLPITPVYQFDATDGGAHPVTSDRLPPADCIERLDDLKILVVDDESDTLGLLKEGLEHSGADVRLAASTPEALASIDKSMPDILISDIGMPGQDGYELIKQLRTLPAERGGKIPAIAITAYARVEDRLQALRAGYQMHVPKPIDLAELVAVTASLASRED
ncbi:MAG TPA: PAS domain S-box protein [Pyrinomonadaceae bacterium]|jgi:PAS domain S-box-containing protein|nr:PAS domain S-box protein [Pyrinomonadaceae bacterium]